MKRLLILALIAFTACKSEPEQKERIAFSEVEVEVLLEDSISIRAIEIMGEDLAFAGSKGAYGIYNS